MSAYAVQLDGGGVPGSTCDRCGTHAAPATRRCPACGAYSRATRFAARGTVWSATAVHIAVGDFAPTAFTYVDIDDGPRVLVRSAAVPAAIGAAVELVELQNGIEVRPCT